MGIRQIVLDGDEILRKNSKPVEKVDDKIMQLIQDMWDTMYKYDGIGLAAPQVGILKRIIVYDIGEGNHALINPEVISATGEQWCEEGCLSFPNIFGEVRRPAKVVVRGIDENGEYVTIKAKELLAICLCHEIDHLNGVLFVDTAENIHEGTVEEDTKKKKK